LRAGDICCAPDVKKLANIVAVIGLALGGILGMVGTFVGERRIQSACWAIDGVGLVVASALLALQYFRKDRDVVAAGFLVFSIGEAVMLTGTATSLAESAPSFAAGTALWAASLVLTSVPREFASWVRVFGSIGAILFAITSAKLFWGEPVLPTSAPLPFYAYPFLVATFIGWIWHLIKAD
jgi:hypothetical protein